MELQLIVIGKILLSSILGAIVGYERWHEHKEAGIRTHALVAMGATLFTLISLYGFEGLVDMSRVEHSRIMSQVVTGVGFLGAGMIIFRGHRVHGLTTAAGLWVCAAVGMAVGVGWYAAAAAGTIIMLLFLHLIGRLFPKEDFDSED